MQVNTKSELLGYMQVKVGSQSVNVPIRTEDPSPEKPLASFELDASGSGAFIVVRGESSSKAVEKAMGQAAEQAFKHFSRKLLN